MYFDEPAYERRAVACLRAVAPYTERAATAFGHLLCAIDRQLSPSRELAIVWPDSPDEAAGLLDAVRRAYLPDLLLAGARDGEGGALTPILRERPAAAGRATAYVCQRYACNLPTSEPGELARQLALQPAV